MSVFQIYMYVCFKMIIQRLQFLKQSLLSTIVGILALQELDERWEYLWAPVVPRGLYSNQVNDSILELSVNNLLETANENWSRNTDKTSKDNLKHISASCYCN